jgi:sec-independent protein translocase protein TatC
MSKKDQKVSVLSHLGELRTRLLRSVIVVAVTSTVAFIFSEQLYEILTWPVSGIQLQAIELTEVLGTTMRVSLIAGVIAAVPWLTWELVMFVSPALTKREKKYVYLILPWIALMFLGGVAFSYFIVVPRMISFLLEFGNEIAQTVPRLKDYISIVSKLLLSVGLVFEMPVLTTFLARIGVLKPEWLSGKRKLAIVLAFIIGAIITPTIDPVNQSLIAMTIVILYEMCIWLAKLAYKQHRKAEEQGPFLD